MHLESYNTSQILEIIEKAKNIAVMPSKISGVDAFCAASALVEALNAKGKSAFIIYQGKIPEGCENLVRKDLIKSDAFERTLEVSIDYTDLQAPKLHYAAENNVLKMYLNPVPKDFDANKRVQSKVSGLNFDVAITIGVVELHDLGQIYSELRLSLDRSQIINIDNTKRNRGYGYVNIIDDTAHTLSGLVFNLFAACKWSPSEKEAKALLHGMSYNRAKY